MDGARDEATRAVIPRIVVRCGLLGVAVDVALLASMSLSDGPKHASLSLVEMATIALLGLTFGLTAAPVAAVEVLGARRPRSGRRDATVAAATFGAALLAAVLAFFEGFYLEELLRSGSPSRSFSAVSATFAQMEPVHLARVALLAGAFALPFPVVAIGRLRGVGLLRQLGEIVFVGLVAAGVLALGVDVLGGDELPALLAVVLVPSVGVGATLPFLYRGADLIESRVVRWWLGRGASSGETRPGP